MNRRDFLFNSSLMGASLMVLPRLSLANSQAGFEKNFVLIQMQGGWDVTLSLDPKTHKDHNTNQEKDIFIEYSEDEIINKAGSLKLGPAAAPIADFSSEMSIINGVILAPFDVGHSGCLNYIASGNSEGKAPVLPIEFASLLGQSSLGVLTNSAISPLDRPVMISATSNVSSIVSGNSIDLKGPRRGAFNGSLERLLKMSNKLGQAKRHLDKLEYNENDTSDAGNLGKLLAATLAAGLTNSGLIDLRENLDSHSNHPGVHLKNQTKGWQDIASIFKTFKSIETTNGRTVFDDTLFMVISEFARTPALNTSKGKDHNPLTNSVLFAGGMVKGGQSIGHSHVITAEQSISKVSQHAALPIHKDTLEPARTLKVARDEKYLYITPEVIAATAASILKLNPADVRNVDMKKTFVLSSLLK